jgi:hypothetical protein
MESKAMNRFNNKMILTLIAFFLLIFYFIFYNQSTVLSIGERNMCKAKSKALDIEFSGVLIRKYKDKSDHLKKKVKIISNRGGFESSFLTSEMSGFFEELIEGDSLIKEMNSLEVRIFRGENHLNYFLDYMCPD